MRLCHLLKKTNTSLCCQSQPTDKISSISLIYSIMSKLLKGNELLIKACFLHYYHEMAVSAYSVQQYPLQSHFQIILLYQISVKLYRFHTRNKSIFCGGRVKPHKNSQLCIKPTQSGICKVSQQCKVSVKVILLPLLASNDFLFNELILGAAEGRVFFYVCVL